jgi:hypothetical protein
MALSGFGANSDRREKNLNKPAEYEPLFDVLPDSDVDRTAALNHFYIAHPAGLYIQARVERLLRESRRNAGLAAHAILISGPSGVGKSEALLVLANHVNAATFKARGIEPGGSVVDEDGMTMRTVIPVAYYNVPERADLKDFYAGFLESLGDENPVGSTSTLRLRVQKAIKDAGTELIIIDELQHLFDTENMRIKRNVANAIKRMLDVVKVPIAICGMDDARKIFGPTRETKRRTDWCINVKAYDIKQPKDRSAFFEFLESYDEALVGSGCFTRSSNLSDKLRGSRIYFASRGCVGHVARLIKAAGTLAIEAGSHLILDAHFRAACDLIFLQDPKEIDVNPFELTEMPAPQVILPAKTNNDEPRSRRMRAIRDAKQQKTAEPKPSKASMTGNR